MENSERILFPTVLLLYSSGELVQYELSMIDKYDIIRGHLVMIPLSARYLVMICLVSQVGQI